MKVFPLPEREQRIWKFDQIVNDRGMPVDISFAKKAFALATRAKTEALDELTKLTGLENSNSNAQMLAWAKTQGYKYDSLEKEFVASDLKYNTELTPLGRQVLEARKAASSTTYKKLAAIIRQICPDGRLRNQFLYRGSARCGRWSGNSVQLQNLARPDSKFEDLEILDKARALIHAEDYIGIQKEFGSVLLTVKSCIRTVFVAKSGRQLSVCDLGAIEARVGAWMAGCHTLLKVFKTYLCLDHPLNESFEPGYCKTCQKKLERMDVYLDLASKLTGIPYIQLARDIKSTDPIIRAAAKKHRQMGKVGILGCFYRLSGGKIIFIDGIQTKDGLWKYAEDMGIEITQEEANTIVKVFREVYKEVPEMWYAFERAVSDVLKGEKTKRELGPNGCIKIDKLTLKDKVTGERRIILRIQLPTGQYLHYLDARIESRKMPWQKTEFVDGVSSSVDVYKDCLVYAGINQITKQWGEVTSHGGKIFENTDQGIAREVLAECLLAIEYEADMPVIIHVHDEGVSEIEDNILYPDHTQQEKIMSREISWAPGLPLTAEGHSGIYYHK